METARYIVCEKCGIKRNIEDAPDCPICLHGRGQVRESHGYNQSNGGKRRARVFMKMCLECGVKSIPTKEPDGNGGFVLLCGNCGESFIN